MGYGTHKLRKLSGLTSRGGYMCYFVHLFCTVAHRQHPSFYRMGGAPNQSTLFPNQSLHFPGQEAGCHQLCCFGFGFLARKCKHGVLPPSGRRGQPLTRLGWDQSLHRVSATPWTGGRQAQPHPSPPSKAEPAPAFEQAGRRYPGLAHLMPGTRSGSVRRAPGVHRPCRAVGLATAPRRDSAACTWCRHTGPTPPSCFRAPPRALRRGLRELGCPARGLLCRCGPHLATPKAPVSPSASAAVPGQPLPPAPPLPLRPGTRRRETNRALGCGFRFLLSLAFHSMIGYKQPHVTRKPRPTLGLGYAGSAHKDKKATTNRRPVLWAREIRSEETPPTSHGGSWCGRGAWALGHKSRSAAFSAMGFHWTVSLSPSHSCLSLAGRPSLHLERRGQASAPEFVAGVLMACLHFPLASFGRRHPPQRPPGAQAAAASAPSSTTPALSRIHSGGLRLTASPSGRLSSGALPCDVTERGGGL